MTLKKETIECLKIIGYYTTTKGSVGLTILERKLFDLIGFEYALQNNINLVKIVRELSNDGFIIQEGLSSKITEKGRELLNDYKESKF